MDMNQLASNVAKQLKSAEVGLQSSWKPGYIAYVTESDEGGYTIAYHKSNEEMPAYETESFKTLDACVKEMIKISMEWREIQREKV